MGLQYHFYLNLRQCEFPDKIINKKNSKVFFQHYIKHSVLRCPRFYPQPFKYFIKIHKIMSSDCFISKECTPRTTAIMGWGGVLKWKEHSTRGRLGKQFVRSPGFLSGLASWMTLARGVTSPGLFPHPIKRSS